MSLSVGDAYRYNAYVTTLSNLQSQLDQTTEEVSSGKKVASPSDNPSSYAQNLEIVAEQTQNTQCANNLNSLKTSASYYETSVNSVSDILTTVKQLAVETASSTSDSNARSDAATEVDNLIEQLVSVGNTKAGSSYLFGGTNASNPAYTVDTSSGTPVVTFQGSAEVGQVAVTSSTTVAAGFSGQSIFSGTVNGTSVDIFQTLTTFSEDLKNTSGLSSSQQLSALQTDMSNIDNCVDLTANSLSAVGSYTSNITNLLATNSTTDTSLTQISSELVDADTAQAISQYSTLSTAYQAALYVMAKVESMNILQYLPT